MADQGAQRERRTEGARRVLREALVLTGLWAYVLWGLGTILETGGWVLVATWICGAALLTATGVRAIWPRRREVAAIAGILAGALVWFVWFLDTGRAGLWREETLPMLRNVQLEVLAGVPPMPVGGALQDVLLLLILVGAIITVLLHSALEDALPAGIPPALLLLIPPAITTTRMGASMMIGAGLLLALLVWVRSPRPSWRGIAVLATAGVVAWAAVGAAPPSRDRVWNEAIMVGPTSGMVPDVMVALGNDLNNRGTTEAFRFTSTKEGPVRFYLTTLSEYDGTRWLPEDQPSSAGLGIETPRAAVSLQPDSSTVPPGDAALLSGDTALLPGDAALPSDGDYAPGEVTVTIRGLVSSWMPLPQAQVQAVDVQAGLDPRQWEWNATSNTARSQTQTTGWDDQYTARSEPMVAEPVLRDLATVLPAYSTSIAPPGTDVPAGYGPYLDLPSPAPPALAAEAESLAGDLDNRLLVGFALQDFFLSGAFTYDEAAPYAPGVEEGPYSVMESFLQERRGYCVHYASTFAVMARHLGVPTRLAVGYASSWEGGGSVPVLGRELHAWPEIYVENIGWIAFEPTPGGAGLRAEGIEPVEPEEPVVDTPAPELPDDALEIDPVGPQGPDDTDPTTPDGTDAEPEDAGRPWWLFVLAGLVVLALPHLVRRIQRARRTSAVLRGLHPGENAWMEFTATALDLGLLEDPEGSGPRARTPEALIEHLEAREVLGRRGAAAARRIATAYGAERYGGSEGGRDGQLARALREVLAELGGKADRGARGRAALLPASLFRTRAGSRERHG